jgi:hypothetical protein
MVVHVVLLRIRPDVSATELSELEQRISELAQAACGPGNAIVGENVTEEPIADGFDFGFVLRFRNRGALDAYHVNPTHLAIAHLIRDLASKVLVFDVAGGN